jgi:hypothetical protein
VLPIDTECIDIQSALWLIRSKTLIEEIRLIAVRILLSILQQRFGQRFRERMDYAIYQHSYRMNYELYIGVCILVTVYDDAAGVIE